jgi:pimeloyl-ACP methyl ester carboxylesterase
LEQVRLRAVTTFGLVHGAWHGAWCWDLLVAELEARGHRAIAVDLPADDPDAGYDAYVATVLNAFDGVDGDELVVVGHSLGGLTASVVAASRPVRHLVLLCALVPDPGLPLQSAEAVVDGFGGAIAVHDDGSTSWPVDAATAIFFHDCDPALAAWAASNLRRQAVRLMMEPCPLEAMPAVPMTYVLGTEERAIDPAWSRAAAARLGAAVVELPGGHSPFLARPAALADVLSAV